MARRRSRPSKSLRGRRPVGHIDERKLFLIVTEGKTEERYFQRFRSSTGPKVVIVDAGDSKVRLVERAIEERSKLVRGRTYVNGEDSTWVVLDRDVDHTKPNDKQAFNEALSLADRNDIKVAYSNDSFELWVLLHFQDVTSAMHRTLIDEKLKKYIPSYKHGDDIYDLINDRYSDAVKRAGRLLEGSSGNPIEHNPSTTVHQLTEELLKDIDYIG